MQTKSTIQIIAEGLQAKFRFFELLEEIMEKYEVEDNVFCCGVHGVIEEPKKGYFGQLKEYDTLLEAQKEFSIYNQGVRIKGNKIFVGNLYSDLKNVNEDIIIDLEKSILIQA